MIKFLRNRWFLIALIIVLALGMAANRRLEPLADARLVRDGIVALVLFLMALPLQASVIWQTMRRPGAALLAVAISYGLLPIVAWGVALLLPGGQGPGMLIAATTPCTVASASVWTRRAGGNDAAATMVTLITNLMCFLAMPLWLAVMMGRGIESEEFEFQRAVWTLGKLVVLPMVAAQLLRLYQPLANWATRHKLALSAICQCGILYMVFVGAIRTGIQVFHGQGPTLALSHLLVLIAAVIAVHVAMFAVGMVAARWLGLSRGDQIAVGFAGSQKTLMIGLKVALDYGVSILPMVSYHVCSLLVDTVLADRIARQDAARNSPDKPPAT